MVMRTSMAARCSMAAALIGTTDGAGTGLAYSGGGIPGVLQSMCSQDWLYGNVPGFADADHSVSTASGGTIGYMLYQSLGSEGLEFPVPLSFDLTKDELSQKNASTGRKYWANVAKWLSELTDPFGADPMKLGAAPNPQDGWWQDALRTGLFQLFYGVSESEVGQALGLGHHIVNLAVLEREACPLELTGVNGWMAKPERLHMATLEHLQGAGSFGDMQISGGMEVRTTTGKDWQPLDAAAYSSFFFTIGLGLVTNPAIYATEKALELLNKGILISAKTTDRTKVYLTDGGLADTTGIVAHLQRKVSRIFAIYDTNNCLKSVEEDARCEKASIAYLFGRNTSTNGQNTMGGPLLSQVFEGSLYESVIANLTDPAQMLARLTNVKVMRNDYFEVEPYTVDEVMILSNARSEAFLAEFKDPAVRLAVDDLWPDRIGLTPDVFNANMMCQHQRWKLDQHSDKIKAFFAASATSEVVV